MIADVQTIPPKPFCQPSWPKGDDLIAKLGKGACLLQFSAGKDSIACWLALRGKMEIAPYYLYLIPDLEFVEESLRYYEKFFGQRVIRVPHPSLYRMIANHVFRPPEQCMIAEDADLPEFSYDDVEKAICDDRKMPKLWSANGARMADSIMRRQFFTKYPPINPKRRVFYPVWDWNVKMIVDAMNAVGCRLPIDYDIFGMSFDGLDFRFLKPIKEHFPRDYARILEWFPLAELELYRYEQARKHNLV